MELEQDEWTGKFFENLEVIGWQGRSNGYKVYFVKCSICACDPELYGDGIFRIQKNHLMCGIKPCGCSKNPKRSEQQYITLCHRQAEKLGCSFNGWSGDYIKSQTRLSLNCKDHGEWTTTSIRHFLGSNSSCPLCGYEKCREINTKSDKEIIDKFFATGSFVDGTLFKRSDRLNSQNKKCFWEVYCPACQATATCSHVNLLRGTLPCDCGRIRQRQAYINLIKDDDVPIAIKFGISYKASLRLEYQTRKTHFNVEQLFVYEFDNVEDCFEAERELKSRLICGVLGKADFPDGYTETTYLYNIDDILKTFQKFSGKYIKETI